MSGKILDPDDFSPQLCSLCQTRSPAEFLSPECSFTYWNWKMWWILWDGLTINQFLVLSEEVQGGVEEQRLDTRHCLPQPVFTTYVSLLSRTRNACNGPNYFWQIHLRVVLAKSFVLLDASSTLQTDAMGSDTWTKEKLRSQISP